MARIREDRFRVANRRGRVHSKYSKQANPPARQDCSVSNSSSHLLGLAAASLGVQSPFLRCPRGLRRPSDCRRDEGLGQEIGQFCEAIGNVPLLFPKTLACNHQFTGSGGSAAGKQSQSPSNADGQEVNILQIETKLDLRVCFIDVLAPRTLASAELPLERLGRNGDAADANGFG